MLPGVKMGGWLLVRVGMGLLRSLDGDKGRSLMLVSGACVYVCIEKGLWVMFVVYMGFFLGNFDSFPSGGRTVVCIAFLRWVLDVYFDYEVLSSRPLPGLRAVGAPLDMQNNTVVVFCSSQNPAKIKQELAPWPVELHSLE